MPFFPCAHAAHPVWKQAVHQVIVQLNAQISVQQLGDTPCLGLVYVSAPYASDAAGVAGMLASALPQVQHWVGCTGHGVLAGDMDYGAAGAVAVMLAYVQTQDYHVFSDAAAATAQGFVAQHALVHGDAASTALAAHLTDLQQQLQPAAMVGGVSDLQTRHVQWTWGLNAVPRPASIGGDGVQMGGLSGVAFSAGAECLTLGMHACRPSGRSYTITGVEDNVVLELEGRSALDILNIAASGAAAGDALPSTLWAVAPACTQVHSNCLPPQARVLRVMGVDTQRQGLVLSGRAQVGEVLTGCLQDVQAARADMRRACAQVLDALTCDVIPIAPEQEPGASASHGAGRSISGAIYIRNHARHGRAPRPRVDMELQWIRHALGPVPLLGFSSSAEIEGPHLQHLSAQLLVFTQPLQALS